MPIDEKALEEAKLIYWAEWVRNPNSAFQQLEASRQAIIGYEAAKSPTEEQPDDCREAFQTWLRWIECDLNFKRWASKQDTEVATSWLEAAYNAGTADRPTMRESRTPQRMTEAEAVEIMWKAYSPYSSVVQAQIESMYRALTEHADIIRRDRA